MQRIMTFAIMLIALAAFCAPSLARGFDAVSPPSGDTAVTAIEGASVLLAPKCKLSGGKRLLPCHSDLAEPAPSVVPSRRLAIPLFGLPQSLVAWAHGPDAELPPPRLG
ncbi:MAG TPA: hypothetical protein VL133_09515 [Devosia sp.]|nr:hypothetical protein [Devosia sp.]